MNGLLILVISIVFLSLAYLLYGRFLARIWKIDPNRKTPAHEYEDGKEYVPTSPAVVFGYEFASIAGAGPINGPIIAAMFGWVPALLWLLFGSAFFGAVHDFAALYTSVKNKGKTIGYVIEQYVGKTGKTIFLIFIWLFSVLIAGAFADIVAGTFAGFDISGTKIETNASVASTSGFFIVAAIGLGFLIRKRKASDLASAIVAVDLLIVCIVLGIFFPVFWDKSIWLYLIFGYILVSSVLPIWLLGQPRNYLSSFLLIAMIIAAFFGVVLTNPEITLPAFTSFKVNGNYLFPALFITIACGAISGFHSLVATGAASKQISSEKYMLPISYGAMLVETLVAILALIAVGSIATGGALTDPPPVIFAKGVSGFLSKLGLPSRVSFTIVSLAVSSFVLTTLETVGRLGRLSFEELFTTEEKEKNFKTVLFRILKSKPSATIFTLGPAFLLAIIGYQNIWALFGTANQLLAALTLIACTMFFKKTGRKIIMLLIPTAIMLIVTFTSLVISIGTRSIQFMQEGADKAVLGSQIGIALMLFFLGIMVTISCGKKVLEKGIPVPND